MFKTQFLTLNILVLCFQGFSQKDTMSTLPGNTSLPSSAEELSNLASKGNGNFTYSVEDYFAKPAQTSFQFSPNGSYLSYQEKDENSKNHVYVKEVTTGKITRIIEEKEELINGYMWVNETRIVYLQDQGGNENYRLFAVNIDGSNAVALTPFEGVNTTILKRLKEQPDYLIISMNKNNPQFFEPYRLNINNGELELLYENPKSDSPIVAFEFDKNGELRGYTQQEDVVNYTLYYRKDSNEPFEKVITTSWKDQFNIISFDYSTESPHDAYVSSNLENNTTEIMLYDLKEKKILKKLYSDPTFDVDGLFLSRKRKYEIDYYSYTGEKNVVVPISKTFQGWHNLISNMFPNMNYSIVSITDEEDKLLLYIGSDRLYGSYYIFDVEKGNFKLLIDLMPQLKPAEMAVIRPFHFTSRDGLELYGYITIPNGIKKGKKVPLIVNPHGGPYGVRDYWGFNPETQLFASRGYATIQVNYRGSGGYGKEFMMAGNKQIGRNMLNDLEDAVSYAKKLGFIDKNRIAIYGGSYGGLATLGSLVKTPNLYKCGVDYVGVSNLFTFFKSFPEYWKPYLGQVYEQWYNPESEEDKKIMETVSPALNIEQINKPLFVIQGANDPRVNINESDQIVSSLRAKGFDVPYMVKYNEGHGFGNENNQIELYKTMMGFFALHL